MKRAITKIICTSFLEFHKSADDFNYVRAALYLLYGFLANQGVKILNFGYCDIKYKLV